MTPLSFMAAAATALAAGMILSILVPAPKRLQRRIESYLSPSVSSITSTATGPVRAVFGPMVRDLADWIGAKLERAGGSSTLLKLRQAGWYRGLPEEQMLAAFRLRQLRSIALASGLGLLLGQSVGGSLALRVSLLGLGLIVGATRTRARMEKAIDVRRERMKIEIYTINQLMAMRVRAGGGVMQAVISTTSRGRGEVVSELQEALRLQRAGWRGPDALRRISELTPEPFCARTYRLLASAEERGADLAPALLALAEDVRESRRESLRRTATKRRAGMLIPTIAILAPVLILFVAAPLPYLITGWQ